MKKIKLKPCPFCGGNRVIRRLLPREYKTKFVCPDCFANVTFYAREINASKAWNRRAKDGTVN